MIRVALFVGVLALVFAAAAGFGRAVGPLERETPRGHTAERAEQNPHAEAAERELSVEVVPGPSLRFRVVDEQDRSVGSYDVLHARPMHLIVVRRDLAYFEHLHPKRGPGGTWFVPHALPAPGTYTGFVDFSTGGVRHTLQFDLHAGSPHGRAYDPRPLPRLNRIATAGPYRVRLAGDVDRGRLAFTVLRDGRPVSVGRYLGARGHLVALRERDLRYLHVHADEQELSFQADFPSVGRYRLYLQFRAGGIVRTAEFAVEVGR